MLIHTQSGGYFCLNVAPQRIPRPPLKTSATDFTWRQRLNEYGSTYFNKCHISFGFATLPPKRRLAQRPRKNTHFFMWHSSQNCPQSQHSPLAHNATVRGGQLRHRELDNIIGEQQDPHKLTWARSSWTVQRQSHGISKSLHLWPRSVFFWGC